MRVTDKMIFDQAATRGGAARDRLEKAVAETSTGMRVEHPWDDPAAAGASVGHQLSKQRQDAIGQAAGRASDELVAADGALGSLVDTVSRARELAVQLSNDSYDATERAGAASEVRQLFQRAVGLLNTQVGNRYIFGGNLDGAPPFDTAGAYAGDAGVRQLEVMPGVLQPVSVRADEIAKGAGGGTDLFATLDALATALEGNNTDGVRATLDGLDKGISQISLGLARTGAAMHDLDASVTFAKDGSDSETTAIAHLTEADIVDSASNMALAQRALDAALTAASKSFDLSLLDRLR